MRVAFVQPGFQARVEHTSLISVVPPLELASCAALIRQGLPDSSVELIDGNVLRLDESAIATRISEFGADVVVTFAATHTVKRVASLASLVSAPVILLGTHGSALPAETLEEFAGIDVVVIGEPEETLLELLEVFDDRSRWPAVQGLAFRDGDDVTVTGRRALLTSLDRLPYPARDLLPNRHYSSPYGRNVTALRTTRGCPGRCVFCDSHLLYGCGTRVRSPESVVDEIALCQRDYGIDYVAIIDHTFTADPDFVAAVCQGLIARQLHRKVRWVCNTRVDMLGDDLVKLMRRAGCLQVGVGIESGDNRRLADLKKGISEDQLALAIRSLRRHGIIAMGYAIVGFPDDSLESLAITRERIFHFDPHVLQLSFATPLPGTALWQKAKRENRLLSTDWDDFVFLRKSILRGDHLDTETLQNSRDGLLREFYLRPGKMASLAAFFALRTRVSVPAAGKAATKVLRNLMRGSS